MNITGRLTADARVRTLENQKQLVSFSVAVNESYRNRDGERVTLTEFFDCAYWRNTTVAQYLTKGTLVQLEGWVYARSWITKEGEARAGINMRTNAIKFFGTGNRTEEQPGENSPTKKTTKERKSKGSAATEEKDDLPF